MKTRFTICACALTLMLGAAHLSLAQRKGDGRDHDKKHEQRDEKKKRKHDHDLQVAHHKHDHHDKHVSRRRDIHYRAWTNTHRPGMEVRYAYFPDYNVYYDYHRKVYLTLSGRRWVASAALPFAMRTYNPHHVAYAYVDYCGDDLYSYHRRHVRVW